MSLFVDSESAARMSAVLPLHAACRAIWLAIVVLPLPGVPTIKVSEPLGKPPPRIWSRCGTPDSRSASSCMTLSVIRSRLAASLVLIASLFITKPPRGHVTGKVVVDARYRPPRGLPEPHPVAWSLTDRVSCLLLAYLAHIIPRLSASGVNFLTSRGA